MNSAHNKIMPRAPIKDYKIFKIVKIILDPLSSIAINNNFRRNARISESSFSVCD